MNRRALLLVLVAILVLSIVGLTACEEPETDIAYIITAPNTQLTTTINGMPMVIKIIDAEIILKDTPNKDFCGNAQIKIEISNQVAFNIRVAFVSKGNNILVETKDLLTGEVDYQQLSLSDAMDLAQTNVGELPPEQVGDMAIDPAQLEALQEALVPIVGALDQLVDESMDDALVTAIKTLFDKSKKIGKAKYVFNVERFKDLNDDLYTLPLEQVLSKYYGNGDNKYVDTLKQQATNALQEPMSQVLKGLADGGITDVMLADLADAIVQIASQGENTSVGQMLGYSTTIEYLRSNDFQQTTLQSFLQSIDIPIGSAEIDSIFAQLENTLYQLIFGENAQESQQAYDQVNQLLDDIGQAVNLSVELKKDKINRAELSLHLRDIPVNASVEEGVEIGNMHLSTTVIVDAENKETSTYNYEQLENKWFDPTIIADNVLMYNGFEQQGKTFTRHDACFYRLESEYVEKYNVIADGSVWENKYITVNSLIESQQQDVCNNNLLFTYRYLLDVRMETRFAGDYWDVNVLPEDTYSNDVYVENYQEEKEFWVYINKETGDIHYATNCKDIFAVHGKENIVYDGTTVKCSSCNVSWQCNHENMQQSECGSGSAIDFTCPTCGFTEQRVTNEHKLIYQTVEYTTNYFECKPKVTFCKCACGEIDYVELSTTCRLSRSSSYYIADDGSTHYFETSVCSCGLTMQVDQWDEVDGVCLAKVYETITLRINGETILQNHSQLRGYRYFHELQTTYQDDNGNCGDGYTVTETCKNCDYQNSYWSIGHLVATEYSLTDESNCYAGVTSQDYCAICGMRDDSYKRYGHEGWATETISDQHNHSIVVGYCICGGDFEMMFGDDYTVSKVVTEDVFDVVYAMEHCNMKLVDSYQCISKENKQYTRTVTIYANDQPLWSKSWSQTKNHDCPDFTQWTDNGYASYCPYNCYIRHQSPMHQHYKTTLDGATQGMDVCSGHEEFLCSGHECSNAVSKLVQGDASPWVTKFNLYWAYNYHYYECPDCGLGFLVQRTNDGAIVDFRTKPQNFTSVLNVYIIKDGNRIATIDESVFSGFSQSARQ